MARSHGSRRTSRPPHCTFPLPPSACQGIKRNNLIPPLDSLALTCMHSSLCPLWQTVSVLTSCASGICMARSVAVCQFLYFLPSAHPPCTVDLHICFLHAQYLSQAISICSLTAQFYSYDTQIHLSTGATEAQHMLCHITMPAQ